MLRTQAIEQFATHLYGVFAFRITDRLTREDLKEMAETMNRAFDHHEEIDLLISFRTDEDAELIAGLSAEAIKAQFRALSKVRNYCVAYAPEGAEAMIEFFDNILPVKARTFASEHNALEHLRAQPGLAKSAA